VFLIPVILVCALVVYAIASNMSVQNGTLIVTAQSSNTFYSTQKLAVTATVGSKTGTTPMTLTLPVGVYTVTYSNITWYAPVSPRLVTVTGGQTSYAVAVYDPVVEYVSVAGGHFNQTRLTALHDVTPVVWVNPTSDDQIIYSQSTGKVEIFPGQNYTHIFQQAGTFTFGFPLENSSSLEVVVS